jgi:hypothetical protein
VENELGARRGPGGMLFWGLSGEIVGGEVREKVIGRLRTNE